jgi:hypothetical protein
MEGDAPSFHKEEGVMEEPSIQLDE